MRFYHCVGSALSMSLGMLYGSAALPLISRLMKVSRIFLVNWWLICVFGGAFFI